MSRDSDKRHRKSVKGDQETELQRRLRQEIEEAKIRLAELKLKEVLHPSRENDKEATDSSLVTHSSDDQRSTKQQLGEVYRQRMTSQKIAANSANGNSDHLRQYREAGREYLRIKPRTSATDSAEDNSDVVQRTREKGLKRLRRKSAKIPTNSSEDNRDDVRLSEGVARKRVRRNSVIASKLKRPLSSYRTSIISPPKKSKTKKCMDKFKARSPTESAFFTRNNDNSVSGTTSPSSGNDNDTADDGYKRKTMKADDATQLVPDDDISRSEDSETESESTEFAKNNCIDATDRKRPHGEIKVRRNFGPYEARQILDNPPLHKIRTSEIRGNIRTDTVYVFNMAGREDEYFEDDYAEGSGPKARRDWKFVRSSFEPHRRTKDKSLVRHWHYKLRDGSTVPNTNCHKHVYSFPQNRDRTEVKNWDPAIALVHFKDLKDVVLILNLGTGDHDFNNTKPRLKHGNEGKKKKLVKKYDQFKEAARKAVNLKDSKSIFRHAWLRMRGGPDKAKGSEQTPKKDTVHSIELNEKTHTEDKVEEQPSLEAEGAPIFSLADDVASDTDAPLSQFNKTSHATKKRIEEELEKGNSGAKAYGNLNLEAAKKGSLVEPPRNTKHVQNAAMKRKKTLGLDRDDLADVLRLMEATEGAVICDMKLGPEFRVIQKNDEVIKHVQEVQQLADHVVYGYDTTFDLGYYYGSILIVNHPFLQNANGGTPAIPVAIMYHARQTQNSSHQKFFKKMKRYMPCLAEGNTVIVTDREKAILNSITEALPDAKHIPCYVHLRRNVKWWTTRNVSDPAVAQKYRKQYKRLLWSEDEAAYNNLLNKVCPGDERVEDYRATEENEDEEVQVDEDANYDEIKNLELTDYEDDGEEKDDEVQWDDKFKNYFFRYHHTDIRSNFRGEIRKYGIFNQNSGVTSNPSESVNDNILNHILDGEERTLFNCTTGFDTWQNRTLVDIKRAVEGTGGNFRVRKEFTAKARKLPPIEIDDRRDKFEAIQKEPQDEIKTIEDDVNYSTKMQLALIHHRMGNVQPLYTREGIPTGTYEVKTHTHKSVYVNPQENTCTCGHGSCEHKIAVLIETGQLDHPKAKHLHKVTPNTITKAQKSMIPRAAGKKYGQNLRIPASFDKPPDSQPGTSKGPERTKAANAPAATVRIEAVDLPDVTSENARTTVLRAGGWNLSLKDLKSTQYPISAKEKMAIAKDDKAPYQDGWMTDSAVYAYLYEKASNTNTRVIHPSMTSVLMKKPQDHAPGIRERRKDGEPTWESTDTVLLPFNKKDHWVLLRAFKDNRRVLCYDSQSAYVPTKVQQRNLGAALNTLFDKDKKSQWTFIPEPCAQQDDSHSCGPYVCFFGKQALEGGKPTAKPPKNFRQEILKTIVGECKVKEVLNRKPPNQSASEDTCTICGSSGDSQSSQGSQDNQWAQCDRCDGWCHVKCDPRPETREQVNKAGYRYVCV